MITELKDKVTAFVERYETACTALLVIIALILIAIAIYGKPHHKAMAMVYIVL